MKIGILLIGSHAAALPVLWGDKHDFAKNHPEEMPPAASKRPGRGTPDTPEASDADRREIHVITPPREPAQNRQGTTQK
jgi:hypothetical protein